MLPFGTAMRGRLFTPIVFALLMAAGETILKRVRPGGILHGHHLRQL